MKLSEIVNIRPGEYYYDVKSQLQRHVYHRAEQAFNAGDEIRDAIMTKQALVLRQQFVRKQFITSIGGLPTSDAFAFFDKHLKKS